MPGQGRLGDKASISLDAHGCLACPHPGIGPAIVGSPDVNVNRRPAVRVGDSGIHAACCGTNTWKAQQGSATVFINGKAAFRLGDPTKHCGGMGTLIEGSHNVIVGDSGGGGGGATSGGSGTTGGGGGGGGGGAGGGGGGGGRAGGGAGAAGGGAGQTNVWTASSQTPNGTTTGGANEAAQPVQVTLRVIGMGGEPVSATYGGTASGVVKGETKVTVPAGALELQLSDVTFADPIPPSSGELVPAARTFRRRPELTFLATAEEGAIVELQLERAVARLIEVTGFRSAVVLPDALPSLASCFRRLQNSDDKLFFTGHGARSGDRARNVRLFLTGPREAWAEASAKLLDPDEEQTITTWAAGQPGWSGEGKVTKEALGVVFDLYDRSIATLLGVPDLAALRAAVNERLAFPPSSAPPPPRPPDPLYKYGTDKPPRGGRADHYPFLRCTIDAQVYPSKLAKQATGDAADYLKSLDALNPHLCKNGQWSLVLHDEINLPAHYATGLRDFIAKEHYEIHLAPLEPAPAGSDDDNVVDCGQSHVRTPAEKAPGRRSENREVEVVFVTEVPEAGHVCGGGKGACTVATCRLYDPRETELEYVEAGLHWIGLEARDANDEPLANVAFVWILPDGTELPDTLDANGKSTRLDVPPGSYAVVFPGFADGEIRLATSHAAEVTAFSVRGVDGAEPAAEDDVDLVVTASSERVRIVHGDGEVKHELAMVSVEPSQEAVVRVPAAPAGSYRAYAGTLVGDSVRWAKAGKELTLEVGPAPTLSPKRMMVTVEAGERVELGWSSEHASLVRILRDGEWLGEVEASDERFAAPLVTAGTHTFTLIPLRGRHAGDEKTVTVEVKAKPHDAQLVVKLHDGSRTLLQAARFKFSLDGKITEGTTSDAIARATYDGTKPLREAILEWGPADGSGLPFRQELALDVDVLDPHDRRIAQMHNLGYPRHDDHETNLRRFQNDHHLVGERGFAEDGELPPRTTARLDEYFGSGDQVGNGPGNQAPTPVAPACRFPAPVRKPAKQLTLEEARDLLAFWDNNGDIQLLDQAGKRVVQFDATCTKVLKPAATGEVFIGPRVFGVDIVKAMGFKSTPHQTRAKWGGLDVRRMVAVCELCDHVRRVWKATELHCSSFGSLESHAVGIDINGFEILSDGVLTKLFVLEDWGKVSVPRPDFTHRSPSWPNGRFAKLPYRLAPENGVYPPGVSALEHEFFEDIYRHLQTQWSDAGAPTKIGEVSAIMHPDHPHSDPNGKHGREQHQNHFHVELTATTLLKRTITHSPANVRSGQTVQMKVEQTDVHGKVTDVTSTARIAWHGADAKVTATGMPGEFEVEGQGTVSAEVLVGDTRSSYRIEVIP